MKINRASHARVVARSRRGVEAATALAVMILAMTGGTAVSQVSPSLGRTASNPGEVVSLLDDTQSAQNMVLAYGIGPVYGGDVVSARRVALQAAYAEAVALGSGISVGSLTVVRNVEQITDVVLSRARGTITNYEIVSEEFTERDGILEVRIGIEATVVEETASDEDSFAALKLFLGVLGEPRIMIVVSQFDAAIPDSRINSSSVLTEAGREQVRVEGERVDFGQDYRETSGTELPDTVLQATEAAIAAQLNGFGYQTVTLDSLPAQQLPSAELLRAARRGETAAALAVARETGAAALVVGNLVVATRRIAPQGVEFEQAAGELSARAFIVSTSREVQAFHSSATKAHTNVLAAVAAIREELAHSLSGDLAWALPELLAESPHVLLVELLGVENRQAFAALDSLGALDGIIDAQLTALPDLEGRPAVIELRTGFVPVERRLLLERLTRDLGEVLIVERSTKYDLRLSIQPPA